MASADARSLWQSEDGRPTFRGLMQQLEQEHEREVASLRDENELLRARLRARHAEAPTPVAPAGTASSSVQDVDVDVSREPSRAYSFGRDISNWSGASLASDRGGAKGAFQLHSTWTEEPSGAGGDPLDAEWIRQQGNVQFEGDIKKMVEYACNATADVFRTGSGQKDVVRWQSRTQARMKRFLVIDPGSPTRMLWDVAGMVLIGFDLVFIPMMVFKPKDTMITTGLGWTCLLYWTFDIMASCCTGYFEDGHLVTDHQTIVRKYLRTWFAIDLVIVVPDWVMLIEGSSVRVRGLSRGLRILRAARAVRILRLLRVLKLQKLLNMFYDMIESEYMFIVVNLSKLLLFIVLLNHFVACGWYIVGIAARHYGSKKSWVTDSGLMPVYGEDLAWRYTTSLHWSISQFTSGSMDVSATNTLERVFSIVMLFGALFVLCSIIGSVSASMTMLRNMRGNEQKQFWLLRRYLRQCNVSKDLTLRILKYTEHQVQSKQNILPTSKVTLLGSISQQLQHELSHEMNSPMLCSHPFFKFMADKAPVMMYRICHKAIHSLEYAMGDVAFHEGDEAKSMYFVKKGGWKYRNHGTSLLHMSFVGEPVLWTAWRHRGDLVAGSELNEMMLVNPKQFGEVLRLHPLSWHFARRYATEFIIYMNSMGGQLLTDIIFSDDLFERALGAIDQEEVSKQLSNNSAVSKHLSRDSAAKAKANDTPTELTVMPTSCFP